MNITKDVVILFMLLVGLVLLPGFARAGEVLTPYSDPFLLAQANTSEETEDEAEDWEDEDEDEDWEGEDEAGAQIADPLEPLNRVFFHFNDKLYFWLLKPVARGYGWVVPEPGRVCVRNFFVNLLMPVRAVNCLLQGKFKGFGNELLRFFVNSTVGCFGFQDPAKTAMGIEMQDEDFGQTLGVYGLGPGVFITWPIFGPSSIRGTFGLVGDYFLDPVSYVNPTRRRIAIKAGDKVNGTSLRIGEYEDLKEAAIDPYVSVRDVYHQYRENKIKE